MIKRNWLSMQDEIPDDVKIKLQTKENIIVELVPDDERGKHKVLVKQDGEDHICPCKPVLVHFDEHLNNECWAHKYMFH